MQSEAASKANFSQIRYAQCWEDADILIEGLDIQADDVIVSIASAGDNVLAMAGRGAKKVIALDLNPAQIACVELRIAAYRCLQHNEFLELIGSTQSQDRIALYNKCRLKLSDSARGFWDNHQPEIIDGIGSAGKFERYFKLFRERILPLIHSKKSIDQLLIPRSYGERQQFYEQKWDNWRWRALFRIFFSRTIMGRFGRDPAFFRYVEGSVAQRIMGRTQHALIELDPSKNPYLQWILTGSHISVVPYALREENFEAIRANLDSIELVCSPLESLLAELTPGTVDKFNLSDIFEYMSLENYESLLKLIINASRPGAKLAYWNMLADRHRPTSLSNSLQPLTDESKALFLKDKAFFYSDFVIEQVIGP